LGAVFFNHPWLKASSPTAISLALEAANHERVVVHGVGGTE